MKYLVVSDNHGDRKILVDILKQYKGEVDYFFHCGDSELNPKDELWKTYLVVRGNCDYYGGFPMQLVQKTGLDTVFMAHGHLSSVRYGMTQLKLQAEEVQANLALFGHTHQIGCEMHDGILFLNPGSVSQPRGQIPIPAYAVIESTEEQFEIQYYRRTHEKLTKLHFLFKK